MTRQAERVEISDQIVKSLEYLDSKKYSKHTINNHLAVWKRLEEFVENAGTAHFYEELAAKFLLKVYGVTSGIQLNKRQVNAMRSMRILCDAFKYGTVALRIKRRIYNFPSQFEEAFVGFINFRREHGYSVRTEQSTKLYLERFGLYLDSIGVKCFADISFLHLNGFIESQFASGMTKPTVGNTLSILWAPLKIEVIC